MAEKQTNKERLKDITDNIETGIKNLFASDKYADYLKTMSRFHNYSVNNQILIHMQKPNATHVAGFNKWKNEFKRNVTKGEKGIKIIAPTPYKKKVEETKVDPDTHIPILDKDGNAITEEKEIKIPMFKVVSVFDISQTHGEPLPEIASNLSGSVENYDIFMEALKRTSKVPIEFENMQESMDGYFSKTDQRIAINTGMSEVQTISAAVHEMAHSILHNNEAEMQQPENMINTHTEEQKDSEKLSRNTEEVQAESVSFAVCAYYGIETGENSFGYIALWSKGKELSELKQSLETINKTSSELISGIDKNYAVIMKERGLDKVEEISNDAAVQEKVIEKNMPDSEISVDDMKAYGYTDENMLPLTKEKALELDKDDICVYLLYNDNTEGMALYTDDIINHDGIFGISREDWEQIHEAEPEISESDFMDSNKDSYAIYQLKDIEETRDIRFMNTNYLDKNGIIPDKTKYDFVYADKMEVLNNTEDMLNEIFAKLNTDLPDNYKGHSLSVSDIIVLKQDNVVSSYYVDNIGFSKLDSFMKDNNYLKNTEMSVEDDYDMIDGMINNGPKEPTVAELEEKVNAGQSISVLELAKASLREEKKQHEKDEKSSVLAKLKTPKPQNQTKTAPKKSAEREM